MDWLLFQTNCASGKSRTWGIWAKEAQNKHLGLRLCCLCKPCGSLLPWICCLMHHKFTWGVWAFMVRITTSEAANKSRWWPWLWRKGPIGSKTCKVAHVHKRGNFTSQHTREHFFIYWMYVTVLFSFPPTDHCRLNVRWKHPVVDAGFKAPYNSWTVSQLFPMTSF